MSFICLSEHGSDAFEEFLELIGMKVKMKGFSKYRAQLDNKSESVEYMKKERERERKREREGEREREGGREREREGEREKGRERKGEREREGGREREKKGERERKERGESENYCFTEISGFILSVK